MKHTSLIAALLSSGLLCGTLAAAPKAAGAKPEGQPEPTVYTHYQDWRFQPVTTTDPDAWTNVRNQMDFTVPIHGPWLTNPSETGMTVTWITRIRSAGGIEYRKKGTENWTKIWKTRCGQVDYTSDIQSIHLKDLKPGTEYEYRLLSNLDRYNTAYYGTVCEGREIYTFRTLNPEQTSCKVFVTSGFSGSARLTLDPMIERTNAADSDLFVFLGDSTEIGVGYKMRYLITLGFLDDITRKWGKTKPTLFLRGDRELDGSDSYFYGDYFPRPDGKLYHALTLGPVLFICLDTMADTPEPVQKEQYINYLKEQANWLAGLKKTEMWKKAAFRVVLGHFSPVEFSAASKNLSEAFRDVLNDTSAEGRIHLYLAGHEPAYFRINPGSKELIGGNNAFKDDSKVFQRIAARAAKLIPDNVPYTLTVCHIREGMTLEADAQKLTVKSCRWDKIDGGVYDSFEIAPDGKVKTLIEDPLIGPSQAAPKAAVKK